MQTNREIRNRLHTIEVNRKSIEDLIQKIQQFKNVFDALLDTNKCHMTHTGHEDCVGEKERKISVKAAMKQSVDKFFANRNRERIEAREQNTVVFTKTHEIEEEKTEKRETFFKAGKGAKKLNLDNSYSFRADLTLALTFFNPDLLFWVFQGWRVYYSVQTLIAVVNLIRGVIKFIFRSCFFG